DDVNAKLGLVSRGSESSLSDEDFIRQASHLLISRQLSERKYIYFKEFAKSVSPKILKTYLDTILDSVIIADGRVKSIVFRNGLTHKFIYKA
ncbi:MAG: recombinase family protein, partial [Lachnospiraceae bacterium]|nr:recombinase family protein [Lachnospiraceae bacterium]